MLSQLSFPEQAARLPNMARPLLYYVRHGETDWNRAGRLQGRRDTLLNARGREQAVRCGEILRDIFARNGQNPAAFDYVASPLMRARETMEGMRELLGLSPAEYQIEPRLAEMSFGDWEGLTLAEVAMRDPERLAARERDKWAFVPPNGESYQQLCVRVGEWYEALRRDSVVAAHGGTMRALMVHLGIERPATAPRLSVEQGVVYLLAPGSMQMLAAPALAQARAAI
jgi:broad specificity phosphatase PhoE